MPDFTPLQWALVGVLAMVQLVLLAVALVQIARTPSDRLTLPRVAWILLCFIQFVGPIAFLAAGRKPAPHHEEPTDRRERPAVEQVVNELYPRR